MVQLELISESKSDVRNTWLREKVGSILSPVYVE